MTPWMRRLMAIITVLAVCGIVVSSVSLARHYAKSKTEFCDIAETFNCDIVNRSEYSSIFGMPVALIGVLGYAAVTGLATIHRERRDTPLLLLVGASAGLAFALYLTYIEARVLGVWCILCLSSLALIASITALSVVVWVRSKSSSQ